MSEIKVKEGGMADNTRTYYWYNGIEEVRSGDKDVQKEGIRDKILRCKEIQRRHSKYKSKVVWNINLCNAKLQRLISYKTGDNKV